MTTGNRWYPTPSQLNTPAALERSFRQVLKNVYETTDKVSGLAAPSATPNGSTSASQTGPATSMMLGLHVVPIDTAAENDGVVLTYVKAEGNLQFKPVGSGSSGVTSLNAFGGVVSIAAGSGVTVTPSGGVITIAATGAAVPTFNDAIVPAGTINGTNAVFTLSPAPSPAASLELFLDGILQRPGLDFTLAGGNITYAVAPTAGSTHVCWYRS